MRFPARLRGHAHAVGEKAQRALRGDARIEQAQAARRAVARVGELLLSRLPLALVQLLEIARVVQDLAADFEVFGVRRLGQAQRNRAHGAQVRRDVFARRTVAARRALHEGAVAVGKADGQAVELRLDGILDRPRPPGLRAPACRTRAPRPLRRRCRATASACGGAPRRTRAAAPRPRAASGNRRCAAPGALPRAPAARGTGGRTPRPESPDRPARSSGSCGARSPGAAARPAR